QPRAPREPCELRVRGTSVGSVVRAANARLPLRLTRDARAARMARPRPGTRRAPSRARAQRAGALVPNGDMRRAGRNRMRQGPPMKTAPTRKMYAYWNARRGSRLAPERGDIEPGAIREILSDSFIVSFDDTADHPFRLAGTRVCTLFGHELKGEPFVQLWDL